MTKVLAHLPTTLRKTHVDHPLKTTTMPHAHSVTCGNHLRQGLHQGRHQGLHPQGLHQGLSQTTTCEHTSVVSHCLSQELHCLSQELHCLSQELHCLSQELHCLSQELHCLSQELHCLSQGLHWLINYSPHHTLHLSKLEVDPREWRKPRMPRTQRRRGDTRRRDCVVARARLQLVSDIQCRKLHSLGRATRIDKRKTM
jgi:hypothetical protein